VRIDLIALASFATPTKVTMECSSATGGSANGVFVAVRLVSVQVLP
jgi:hypothetical protein